MIITAYVLLAFFGYISIMTIFKFTFGGGISYGHAIMWFFSIIISALCAGVIWGGLFQ